jgi:hypothetical protein
VVVVLPVLLLAAGWALDFGHIFVNKTRLQNILDATALSAAIALNYDINKDTAAATTKGKETFNLFKAASGNNELASLNGEALVFEFSKTLVPFTPGTNPPAFVRVTSTDMLQVQPALIRILNQFSSDIPVSAIATAGPVGQNCSLSPLVLCADMTPLDTNCNDGACYGYTIGQIYDLTQCKGKYCKKGYYNLLNLSALPGGSAIECVLSFGLASGCTGAEPGYRNICTEGDTLITEPKYQWKDVSNGIDTRFNSDTQTVQYTSPPAYTQYNTSGLGNNNRVLATSMGDCTWDQRGETTPKVGTGCVFLTQHASIQGSIYAEFISSCGQNGVWDPNNPVLNGSYKIVLFKSPGSGAS